MFTTIIIFIIILSALVFVHELGHFLVARKFGVKAEEFGIGFPPRAWGVYKSKDGRWKQVRGGRKVDDAADTIYSINWVPLGGFVKLGEDEDGGGDPNHFANKPIWQRTFMISAGVTMNIIFAAVILAIGLMIGLPQELNNVSPLAKVSDKNIQIIQVLAGSPADMAGIKIGDIIIGVDKEKIIKSEDLQKYVNERTGEELTYQIKRGNEEIAIKIIPILMEDTGAGGIGIAIAEIGIVKYPWYMAIWEGVKTTILLTWAIIAAFYNLIKGLIIGSGVSADIAGPVGIAALTGQVTKLGFIYILQFAALLSINLAIINFFPFPALDGGRVLFLIIEKIKGSPVKRELETAIHNIGFVLLMILILAVTYRDIAKYSDKFKMLWERIF
ncbi:RIP metalloprotease RseP [Candidatus Falkowbacteria bacterium CG_4_9_14_3_um_filter_36_9]|uniref:Zinc metalloprotease n=2 Tax=Candidatus Falkowiibacteriota TaxID=1752728 RepID=A0A1J4T4R3_9BACT|nr:MAG: RIP metalloprotease RseP [Candidatus Falkowbacteria bacterium CG1_02_37_44]PIV50781.1 MAG: RIP metalloprotease RseP [Candidatus Falkowbacteria bacterium CG02_land_8_20_14_3_00_36_14]PJA10979.1 MAG: RIP metalloprotease RseP [Candidatus Falkowbacteria bacterium CG_4_10_14_0_2_um_filter_36_22]PJB20170.1 MAG: RIP metalloprotease RseP [Candidatus Falkowbacteria bacterium CG_4_9_14_3_um_filter_36_9]